MCCTLTLHCVEIYYFSGSLMVDDFLSYLKRYGEGLLQVGYLHCSVKQRGCKKHNYLLVKTLKN